MSTISIIDVNYNRVRDYLYHMKADKELRDLTVEEAIAVARALDMAYQCGLMDGTESPVRIARKGQTRWIEDAGRHKPGL